jgi:hypothetical protein
MSFEPAEFLTSMLVSSIGVVLFMYGRRQKRVPQVVAGLLLAAFPYFVPSALLMLVIASVILGALYGLLRLGW